MKIRHLISTSLVCSFGLLGSACEKKETTAEVAQEAQEEVAEAQREYREEVAEEVNEAEGDVTSEINEMDEEIADLKDEYREEITEIRREAAEEKKEVFLSKLENREERLEEKIEKIEEALERSTNGKTYTVEEVNRAMELAAARAKINKSLNLIENADVSEWQRLRDPVVRNFEVAITNLNALEQKL